MSALFSSPKFPTVPAPRTPPPPSAPPAPPARTGAAVQQGEADVRDLFRRRSGRRATLLTAGGGAGDLAPAVTPVRKTLLGG